jgi:hypothetical protein
VKTELGVVVKTTNQVPVTPSATQSIPAQSAPVFSVTQADVALLQPFLKEYINVSIKALQDGLNQITVQAQ